MWKQLFYPPVWPSVEVVAAVGVVVVAVAAVATIFPV